jgi:type IV secretory pathway VirB10-like protein
MSEQNQTIDPALLADDHPVSLRSKPGGIRRINKKGIVFLGGAAAVVAVVATMTFNQAGTGVGQAAKDAVSTQGTNSKPTDLKRDALWYANKSDKVEAADPNANAQTYGATPSGFGVPVAGAPATASSAPRGANGSTAVPDLTGKAVTPFGGVIAGKTSAPALGGTGSNGNSAGGNTVDPAEQARQQQVQRDQQAMQQAMTAGLTAPGFQNTNMAPMTTSSSNGSMPGGGGAAMPTMAGAKDEDQNKQERKDQFLKAARTGVDPAYSSSIKTAARSPYELKAGSIIPGVMVSGINSDLPGQVVGQVRENVYDTKTGTHLLIPQGSRLIGLYDAHVAYGQKRVLLAWSRIIYPDGSSFDLKGMPGADKGGYAGFFDEVDNHYTKIFGTAVLMSMISAGVQLSQPNAGTNTTNNAPSVSQTLGASLGQQLGQTAMNITQKNVNIQPTLEIRPGYQFNIMVTADMILPPAK